VERRDRPRTSGQLLAAWIAKEELRRLLALAAHRDDPRARETIGRRLWAFYSWCADTDIPELHTLTATIETWWPAVAVFLATGITNARTEGTNRLVKQVKRVVRELRDLVRHRAKLVSLRTSLKNQVHAVLAAAGVPVTMSDVFGVEGAALLDRVPLATTARARVDSARRLIDMLEFEIDTFTRLSAVRLRTDPGYAAVQTIPGIGPILAAVLVAEIGEVGRRRRSLSTA
jgi:hypothetical protein